jgi:mutator protein MutT
MTKKSVVWIIKKDNKFLMVQTNKENDSMTGLWHFPGGTIENDETISQALNRECEEELHIDDIIYKPIVQTLTPKGTIVFWIYIIHYNRPIEKGSDVKEIAWFTLEEILNNKDVVVLPEEIIQYLEAK